MLTILAGEAVTVAHDCRIPFLHAAGGCGTAYGALQISDRLSCVQPPHRMARRLNTSGPASWGLTPRTCAHAESPPEVLAKPDAGLIASCRFVPAGRNPDTLRSGRRQHTQSLTRTRFKYPNQEHVGHPAREPI